MMHNRRRWLVSPVATADELAQMLTDRTWTLCSGFVVEGHPTYAFLNDATHEDGATEIAIVKAIGPWQWNQVESITFSWCSIDEARAHIDAALRGDYDAHDLVHPVNLRGRLDRPGEHEGCPLCA